MSERESVSVKISHLSDEYESFDIPVGSTIRETMTRAGITSVKENESDFLMDDAPVDLNSRIERECYLTVVPRIQAG